MKILFTHRYFWPDTPPYAAMLRTLAEHCASVGHDVHVFASQPSYGSTARVQRRERLGNVAIARVATLAEKKGQRLSRVINVLIYCFWLFWHVLRQRADVVTAATFPPIVAAWTASLAAKLAGSRFVYHMQDIHPEVSLYSGGALGRGMIFRLLRWLDNQTLRRADAIVVLSQDMANTLAGRGLGKPLPVHIVNNFMVQNFAAEAVPPPDLVKPAGTRRVIFAGNLGKFQNLPLLCEGVSLLFEANPDLELLLLGDGEMKPALQVRWQGHPHIRFAPFLPFAQAQELIRDADLGLVSLAPDIYRVSYPSKVLTYIGLGLPMLALVEPGSALAHDIEANGLGAVPSAATPEAVAEAAARMLAQPPARAALEAYHARHAGLPSVMRQWEGVLEGLQRP